MKPIVRLIAFLALGIFCLLYAFAVITNLRIVWMEPLTGIAAGIAGVLFILIALTDAQTP